MGLPLRILKWAVKEAGGPSLSAIGTHIGTALGNRLGRAIDPSHGVDLTALHLAQDDAEDPPEPSE